ncbi:MAG: hypothetical protein PHX71_10115 [Synergistales bacterium]|nr:hypothetical protein [Synergistales bacterium]
MAKFQVEGAIFDTERAAATWEEDEGDETTKPSTIADLRRRYNEAVERGEESFTIEGLEFLTSYAKYVLQYLDMNNIPDSDKLRDRIKPQEER